MKLRTVMITATISLLITFVFLERYVEAQEYSACDIIAVNDLYKKIETGLKTSSAEDMEAKYDCRILLRQEDNYSNELYTAIRNSDVIFDYMDGDVLRGKIIFPANTNSFLQMKRNIVIALAVTFPVILCVLYTAAFFIHRQILLPFQKLERFAHHIAAGELDIPLTMDRANYFGAFTESFDLMREELKRAKQGEYEANISKKELVAELSHDIKTPVSTIKALCELLEVKVKDADTVSKVRIISQKADIIDILISNLFHATLEELEVLKIEPREEFSTIIVPMFEELNHDGRIHRKNEFPGCLIYCDKLRLNQVIDNIIQNSYKYAATDIDVICQDRKDSVEIEIRDYGSSVAEGDLPLVFEKFFRGANAASHSGSGLGLYLAKKFMEGMEGGIECRIDHGFIVKLTIKKV